MYMFLLWIITKVSGVMTDRPHDLLCLFYYDYLIKCLQVFPLRVQLLTHVLFAQVGLLISIFKMTSAGKFTLLPKTSQSISFPPIWLATHTFGEVPAPIL